MRIAFLCQFPLHYEVFRTVHERLNELPIEIVLQPARQEDGDDNVRESAAFLKELGVPYRTLPAGPYDVVISAHIVTPGKLIQQGLTHAHSRLVRMLYSTIGKNYTYKGGNAHFDLILTIGPYSEERLRDYARCVSIGVPRYDALFSGAYDRASVRASIGLKPGTPMLLYLPTWEKHCSIDRYGAALGACAKDYQIVAKPHPLTLVYEQERVQALRETPVHVLTEDRPIDALLGAADLVITDYSSAIFEAAAADRPLLLLDAPLEELEANKFYNPDDLEHTARDIGVRVQEPTQVAEGIREALADAPHWREQRRHHTRRLFAHTDGRSAERAAEVIREFVAERSQAVHFALAGWRWITYPIRRAKRSVLPGVLRAYKQINPR